MHSNRCPVCKEKFTVRLDDDDDRCLVCIRKDDERIKNEVRESAKSFWSRHPGG